LQILCLAILDCIFIHILNTVAPGWECTRRQLCDALITGKAARICDIITRSYHDFDVLFLQEAAAIFVRQVADCPDLQSRFRLLAPRALDGKRDQNSLILLSRRRFGDAGTTDVTGRIADTLGGPWLAAGDLLAATVQSTDGVRWLLASFHGDSNGLSTQPVVQAVRDYARANPECVLLHPTPRPRGLHSLPLSAGPRLGVGPRAGAGALDDVQRAHLPPDAAQQGHPPARQRRGVPPEPQGLDRRVRVPGTSEKRAEGVG
jgi:hypothetical protein